MNNSVKGLTADEQKLLIDVLFANEYALELLSSELYDIETGTKDVDETTYKKLVTLYDRVRFNN
ncbi:MULTISPECIES: antirepressor AbbA [Bacillus]|uniref:Antirepressor AbbA n=2 Tax=Bacillus TaxID=1386 RepID=A0A0M3R965_9BACI|nr:MULTISPECIES: antirepressor AbbA [Bacillus]ALC80886.1 hypothetical protein AM592_04275 [Bacillus gobiensis]MBP1079827.1 hypothetical protein [Bacillus capparidis]MED1095216.1 antirepressor AbbA [Bacillus capparidis]